MVGGIAAAVEPKPTAADAKGPPKEISVDLGKGVKLDMVLIPAGEFLMGSPDPENDSRPDEKPQHRVRITKPFYLGKYPVTQEQWEAVMGKNPSEFKGPKHPVENVSWAECQDFVKRLSKKIGAGTFQLPSEVQWEYACRAGTKTRYCFDDDDKQLGDYAWYGRNSNGHTHPVGKKKPNAWGLYDMHGNVCESCADRHGAACYAKSRTNDPVGPATGQGHVCRGSSFVYSAAQCRSAARGYGDYRNDFAGLRVARITHEN